VFKENRFSAVLVIPKQLPARAVLLTKAGPTSAAGSSECRTKAKVVKSALRNKSGHREHLSAKTQARERRSRFRIIAGHGSAAPKWAARDCRLNATGR